MTAAPTTTPTTTPTVAIVDYGSGNLHSVLRAFERAAAGVDARHRIAVTDDAAQVRTADRIVLPGVGAFADCKKGLDARPGMTDALNEAVLAGGRPFLGICVGMQLMAGRGYEHGETPGLGWIDGEVGPVEGRDSTFKIPHTGWNNLDFSPPLHPLLESLPPDGHAYFVHSCEFRCRHDAECLATVDHGGPLTAMVGRDNMIGTQFHPEKSQRLGLGLIASFLAWAP